MRFFISHFTVVPSSCHNFSCLNKRSNQSFVLSSTVVCLHQLSYLSPILVRCRQLTCIVFVHSPALSLTRLETPMYSCNFVCRRRLSTVLSVFVRFISNHALPSFPIRLLVNLLSSTPPRSCRPS